MWDGIGVGRQCGGEFWCKVALAETEENHIQAIPKLYMKTQSVPRSKHTATGL